MSRSPISRLIGLYRVNLLEGINNYKHGPRVLHSRDDDKIRFSNWMEAVCELQVVHIHINTHREDDVRASHTGMRKRVPLCGDVKGNASET